MFFLKKSVGTLNGVVHFFFQNTTDRTTAAAVADRRRIQTLI